MAVTNGLPVYYFHMFPLEDISKRHNGAPRRFILQSQMLFSFSVCFYLKQQPKFVSDPTLLPILCHWGVTCMFLPCRCVRRCSLAHRRSVSLQMFYSPDKNNLFLICVSCFPVTVCACPRARVCALCYLWARNPTSSRVIRHAVLVTGNGVADGQAECIIDERVSGSEPPPNISQFPLWMTKEATHNFLDPEHLFNCALPI